MQEVEHNKTFRLNIEAYHLLEQEARDRNLSANAVINNLILNNLKRDRALCAVKRIHVPSQSIRLVTEGLSDERMSEIGRELANDMVLRDLPIGVSGTMSAESVLETMKLLYEFHESVPRWAKTSFCGALRWIEMVVIVRVLLEISLCLCGH